MNKRQEALLEYMNDKNDWVSQRDIAVALNDFYRLKEYNHDSMIMVRKDIKELRNEGKMIISGHSGYKIANMSEFMEWLDKYHLNKVKSLSEWSKMLKEAQNAGQMKLDGLDE